jgi:hypothetical protein
MGELLRGREHLEMAISLYDRERHRPLAFRHLVADAGLTCLSDAAWTLWQLRLPGPGAQEGQ